MSANAVQIKRVSKEKLLKPLSVVWEHTGSNRGPSACKADALNQLSYAPFLFGSAKIGSVLFLPNFFIVLLFFLLQLGSSFVKGKGIY